MAVVNTENKKLTYEEFLAGLDEDVHIEWVDGKVISSLLVETATFPQTIDGS